VSEQAYTGTTERLDTCDHVWTVYHAIDYRTQVPTEQWYRKCSRCGERVDVLAADVVLYE
jgi:hypothetical protein